MADGSCPPVTSPGDPVDQADSSPINTAANVDQTDASCSQVEAYGDRLAFSPDRDTTIGNHYLKKLWLPGWGGDKIRT